MIELTDAAAQDLWGSCGPLPYQIREMPYTIVRNLTDTTAKSDLVRNLSKLPERFMSKAQFSGDGPLLLVANKGWIVAACQRIDESLELSMQFRRRQPDENRISDTTVDGSRTAAFALAPESPLGYEANN